MNFPARRHHLGDEAHRCAVKQRVAILVEHRFAAASGAEALSIEALVTQFLEANRIALEDTGRVSLEYDDKLWQDTSEGCLIIPQFLQGATLRTYLRAASLQRGTLCKCLLRNMRG